ncbi:MAG: pirin family protein [Lewinellaceae bacterium]|nr:pirin family protein [Lewinellaceae bacterium]
MRTIKKLHKAVYSPIDDLITYRAMPTGSIRYLDPFLFLNHHGPQRYGPNNNGLPFGPHPHRGFETLTYILQGDIMHRDSMTGESVINAGGIQWMTAGSGLIHAEVSSEAFKKNGGMEEVIQIWLNLPSRFKMVKPSYIGLQKDGIPAVELDGGRVTVNLISGKWGNTEGPVPSLTDIYTTSIQFKEGGNLQTQVEAKRNILFYVVNGEVEVNGQNAATHTLVEFSNEGEAISVKALTDATLIFCHGEPYNEPIVAHGPFVMNSEAEIRQAIMDYQSGKLGGLGD